MAVKKRGNGAGSVRQLPSGKWQARFRGPDGLMRSAGTTYDTKLDASAWLAGQISDVERGIWQAPTVKAAAGDLRAFSASWLLARELKPSTRALYRDLLDDVILRSLGGMALDKVTPATVRAWYGRLDSKTPTKRAHAYSLLRAIFSTAYSEDLVTANPCRIRGAGSTKKKHATKTASLGELEAITESMPERYRAMVLLAAWCGLRFGELAELRRADLELDLEATPASGTVRVERGMTRVAGEIVVGDPKSHAGRRVVAMPPHLVPVLSDHLRRFVGEGRDSLVFPARHGGHMVPSSLYAVFYPAREAAGRPDLRFHDLRHTGATLAAATGATLGDLMARLGHSTPQAAMVYQHAVADRDKAIAEALSGFATAQEVTLTKK